MRGVRRAEFVVNAPGHLYLDVGTGTPVRFYKDWDGMSVGGRDVNKYQALTLTSQSVAGRLGAMDLRMVSGAMESDMMRATDYEAQTTGCGVDRNGALFDLVLSTTAGSPKTGSWKTGSTVLNTVDSAVYCCVAGGSPGQWKVVPIA
jgi:hypothetical protein